MKLLLITLFGAIALAARTQGPIGAASVHGNMRVDDATVVGNATLFDGSIVETAGSPATLRLGKGVEIRIAAESRGKLYRDRLVLEKGSGELVSADGFAVEASSLRVVPDSPTARGVVSLEHDASLRVSALSSGVRVTTAGGFLLAVVQPGRALAFSPATSGANPMSVTGCLRKKAGVYLLTVATGVVYELTGKDLDSMVGATVTITGTADLNTKARGGASQVIAVSAASADKDARCSAVVGMAFGTKMIIAGVSVAAAAGSAAAIYETDPFGGSQPPASR